MPRHPPKENYLSVSQWLGQETERERKGLDWQIIDYAQITPFKSGYFCVKQGVTKASRIFLLWACFDGCHFFPSMLCSCNLRNCRLSVQVKKIGRNSYSCHWLFVKIDSSKPLAFSQSQPKNKVKQIKEDNISSSAEPQTKTQVKQPLWCIFSISCSPQQGQEILRSG